MDILVSILLFAFAVALYSYRADSFVDLSGLQCSEYSGFTET